jgi:hypothetical protein
MKNEIVLKKFGLVANGISYSENANAFLSKGFTSNAGNTYFNAIRFAEDILIKEDIGQGYARTFLNGIRIYSLKNKELLVDRNYHCVFYSKSTVKSESIKLLLVLLKDAAKSEGLELDEFLARTQISKIIDQAMNGNQVEMLNRQRKRYLN